MQDEYNDGYSEWKEHSDEKHNAKESTVHSNPTPKESITHQSTGAKPHKVTKKSSFNILTILTTTVAAVGAITVVGAATGAIGGGHDVKAEISIDKITDVSIAFKVNIENMDDEEVEINVTNDFVTFSIDAVEGENEAYVPDLKPNVDYSIVIKGNYGIGGTVIAREKFRTLKTEDLPVTRLDSVESECKCNVDGNFYFTMNFVDENNYWSDFEATLTDASGNVATFVFTDDPHQQQSVSVIENGLVGETATLVIKCHSVDPAIDSSTNPITLYTQVVKI